MGRGRAKAKQTKVARKLKYYSPETDLTALQRELGHDEEDSGEDYSALAEKYSDWNDDGVGTKDAAEDESR